MDAHPPKSERRIDSTAFQRHIAQAAMVIDTARLHVFRAADGIDDAAARGEKLSYVMPARARNDTACAITKLGYSLPCPATSRSSR